MFDELPTYLIRFLSGDELGDLLGVERSDWNSIRGGSLRHLLSKQDVLTEHSRVTVTFALSCAAAARGLGTDGLRRTPDAVQHPRRAYRALASPEPPDVVLCVAEGVRGRRGAGAESRKPREAGPAGCRRGTVWSLFGLLGEHSVSLGHKHRWTIGFAVGIGLLTGIGAATAATTIGSSSPAVLSAFNRLPPTAFPVTVSRGQPPESGTLTFRMSFLGHVFVLSAAGTSVRPERVGTLTRGASDFRLQFTRLLYRVAPIKLPNGLRVASQTIALSPGVRSTLRVDRHTGAVSSDIHWVIEAPNTLYNGSHTIGLSDKGQRRFGSFKQIAPGQYSFDIRSHWHASVRLARWSVAGTALPGGLVKIVGIWDGHYLLTVKH